PPSNFATGIQHPFAIQSLILWSGQNGVGFDSSYRHKNENRAPVTFITTIDDNAHMIPGPVFVSGDATAETLTTFLVEVKQLVEKMADQLVNKSIQVDISLEKFKKRLLQEAGKIIKSKSGWFPQFFMIDKSRAERLAIQNVFPTSLIRLCQFHVMQAILRWDKEVGNSFEPQVRPRLSLERKHLLLRAVRHLQRCRFEDKWDKAAEEFVESVRRICIGSATSAETIIRYFEANWFIPEWKALWTDIGLPAGILWEKMLSTNNWTERAFKTFDQIFLASRANKSAYRLVLIIANQWFNYYREWRSEQPRFNREEFEKDNQAYEIWS
ncbi:hypothetical protein BDN70DRAFT_770254, partial [Pholiota conissans]